MARVKWLPEALSGIERLHSFLKDKSADAAARAVQAILGGAEFLENVPEAGRAMPDDSGRRELYVPFGSGAYVLRHMIEDDQTVVIIRVWHSREKRR